MAGQKYTSESTLLDNRGGWKASEITQQSGPTPIVVMVDLSRRNLMRKTSKKGQYEEGLAEIQG